MSFRHGYWKFLVFTDLSFFCFFRNDSLTSRSTTGTNTLFDPEILDTHMAGDAPLLDISSFDFGDEFDAHYGLPAPEQMVIVRAYSDDSDDQVLSEIQPKFIVMFEPNQDFVRRVEVGNYVLWRPFPH